MHVAARDGRDEVIRALIEAGADVNLADGDGKSPLRVAKWHRNGIAVRILKAAGAVEEEDSQDEACGDDDEAVDGDK